EILRRAQRLLLPAGQEVRRVVVLDHRVNERPEPDPVRAGVVILDQVADQAGVVPDDLRAAGPLYRLARDQLDGLRDLDASVEPDSPVAEPAPTVRRRLERLRFDIPFLLGDGEGPLLAVNVDVRLVLARVSGEADFVPLTVEQSQANLPHLHELT